MENQAQYNRQVAGVPDPPKGRPLMRNEGGQNETVSQDEMRLLSECSRSATWQRSLPLGLLAGIVTRAAVDMGKLTPHPRFGAVPKIGVAASVAYILGKVSYANTCRERFLTELPDSNISRKIRSNNGMTQEGAAEGAHLESERFDSAAPPPQMQQPAAFQSEPGEAPAAPTQPPNYDEMRRQNRLGRGAQPFGSTPAQEQTPYQQRQSQPQQQPIWGQQERREPSQPDPDPDAGPPSKLRSRRVNKYGDEIID